MECRAVVSSLSDYIDGQDLWLSDSEVREIETHLGACPKCRSTKLELTEIRTAARELPLHTPPRALWTRVANIIEPEVPKSERPTKIDAPERSRWERFKSRRFTFTLPQLAGAGALALALVVFGISNLSRPSPAKLSFIGVQNALLPDEDQFKADLERRLSAINLRKVNWDPQMRSEFERHLNKVDESLRNSRQRLLVNPGDKVQQQMVLNLYDEKRQLLDDVERLKW
jgi:hypothetical protein